MPSEDVTSSNGTVAYHALQAEVRAALDAATAFLERQQLASGEFTVLASTDPALVQGCTPDPSVFPTAVITHCLSFWRPAAKLAARAQQFLLSEQDANGLWRHWTRRHRHYRLIPPDLDDTCCASAALAGVTDHLRSNRQLVLANRDPTGLFFTWFAPRLQWSSPDLIKLMLAQLRRPLALYLFFKHSSAAPNDIDAVVNANTLFYLGEFPGREVVVAQLLDILRQGRECECDKWYSNPFVVWYFFARALASAAPEAGSLIVSRLLTAEPSKCFATWLCRSGPVSGALSRQTTLPNLPRRSALRAAKANSIFPLPLNPESGQTVRRPPGGRDV